MLDSSSHPSQVKNSISFTQIHRLRRLCSDDYIDIKSLTEGNGLCTSVYYKPTDLHSYLLYSSSHSSHGKNSIPFSQFLRLRRLRSDDSDFSEKSEAMCQFYHKRGILFLSFKRATTAPNKVIDSQQYKQLRRKILITFHPHNQALKSIIRKNFKRGCQHPSHKFEISWQVVQNSIYLLLSYFVAQYVLVIVV